MNDTSLMAGIMLFWVVTGFFLGLWGNYKYSVDTGTSGIPKLPKNPNLFGYASMPFKYIGFVFRMLFYGVAGVPAFVSVLVFTPVTLFTLWLFLRWLRGV